MILWNVIISSGQSIRIMVNRSKQIDDLPAMLDFEQEFDQQQEIADSRRRIHHTVEPPGGERFDNVKRW